MYPKVFVEYRKRNRDYGPVRTLPTPVFFYGMEPGDEISVEIDPGKILEIRLQAVGETNEDGDARVFFELNGQPRTIRVPDRKVKASAPKRPKADPGDPRSRRRSDAGRHRRDHGRGGTGREGRGSADDHRGDEDGDGSLCRERAERSSRCMSIPARRSTPRICWSRSAEGRRGCRPSRAAFAASSGARCARVFLAWHTPVGVCRLLSRQACQYESRDWRSPRPRATWRRTAAWGLRAIDDAGRSHGGPMRGRILDPVRRVEGP